MNIREINSLARIRSRLPNLATAERQVADWVLHHSDTVIQSSMAQVAIECGVSDTTVLRFCRAAGFKGYMDLKLSIARDMTSPTQLVHDDIEEGDSSSVVARKVFLSHIQALYDTLSVLDEKDLDKAVSLIIEAKRIFIVGVGTSNSIVNEAYNKFFRLGLNCHAQTDAYLQLMEASLVGSETLVIAISQSGSSTDPVITLEEASRNGAKSIVITGHAGSPLTSFADVVFLAVSQESRAEAIASRIAQMTIVDALYVVASFRMLDTATKNEDKIWKAIIQKTL
ncbi:MAG: MurR/RpiR family transcriptional regulator [Anaerolineae bacterium]|jgi:DNA-binding MurR/RpiR family transcriptional regulator|nr:MurR/RpiR family transcriptional regulator [Anaerolineae bacterium]MBT7990649.1 MurR/RpiR family transcriptional regulator [Anaerolineae bacterium]